MVGALADLTVYLRVAVQVGGSASNPIGKRDSSVLALDEHDLLRGLSHSWYYRHSGDMVQTGVSCEVTRLSHKGLYQSAHSVSK